MPAVINSPWVPLNMAWCGSGAKLDLHAIYRRPVYDAEGETFVRWDLTGPLPLRRHLDWLGKGYEYLTLADRESLAAVAGWLRGQGLDPQSFVLDRKTQAPFSLDVYKSWLEAQKPKAVKA